MSRPQGHSVAGSIMPKKNSSDTIGNRFRDLQVCTAVPQLLRHRVPRIYIYIYIYVYVNFHPQGEAILTETVHDFYVSMQVRQDIFQIQQRPYPVESLPVLYSQITIHVDVT
jgi:hypothetical protein